MFINAKDHVERCPACGMAVGYERDSFCHYCGEFFTTIGNRWFDMLNKHNDQSLGSLDLIEESNGD